MSGLSDRSNAKYDIAVIGAGASGMMAAIAAAGCSVGVALIEGNSRVGTKLLKTGNGRCNLSHEPVDSSVYHGCTVSGRKACSFADNAFKVFGSDDTRAFFERLGLVTRVRDGYVYPYSEAASDVLDVLRYEIGLCNIHVYTDEKVKRIERTKDAFHIISSHDLYADRVILCTGGCADPKSGSAGSGIRIAADMGLKVSPLSPALVKVRTDDVNSASIAGVRAKGRIRIDTPYEEDIEDYGEIQFTRDGLSGIPVFNISRYISIIAKSKEPVTAHIDLMPESSAEQIVSILRLKREKYISVTDSKAHTAEELMTGLVHKKLSAYILKRIGVKPGKPACDIDDQDIKNYASTLKDLIFNITGTYGFEEAQVTCGGVDISEIDEHMECVRIPGLYLAGEILDIDGPCGGYNLQWAWTSGYIAGTSAGSYGYTV